MRTIRYIVTCGVLTGHAVVRNTPVGILANYLMRGRMQTFIRPLHVPRIMVKYTCILLFVSSFSAQAQAQEATIRIDRIIGDDDTEIYFDRINEIIPDGDGNLYVTDDRRRDIQHITSAGELIRTIGSRGEGPGQFREISSVTLNGDSLVVHDAHSMRVTVFTRDGRLLNTYSLSGDVITIESLISVLPESHFLMYRAPNSNHEMAEAFRIVDSNGRIRQMLNISAADLYDVDDDISDYVVSSQYNLQIQSIGDQKYLLTSRLYNGQVIQLNINPKSGKSNTNIINQADVSMSDVYKRVFMKRGDALPPLTNVISRQNGRFAYKLKRMSLGFIRASDQRMAVLYREGMHPSERKLFIDTWEENERKIEKYEVRVIGDGIDRTGVRIMYSDDDGILYMRSSTLDGVPVLAIGKLELP